MRLTNPTTRLEAPDDWNELTDLLFEGSWDAGLRRHRSPFAFRGVSDAGRALATGLQRLGPHGPEVEEHILRNFRKYAYRSLAFEDTVWNWLAMAQHHGVPTRLLDWTYSPYVALHFATASLDYFDRDGVVCCVSFKHANALLPSSLQDVLQREGSDVFTAEILARAAAGLSDLGGLSPDPFVLFLEPPSLDDRIVNQAALFSIVSQPDVTIDQVLREDTGLHRTIVIPARLKWEIRDKLDQANITERVLFPGLDGLSAWLKRYYVRRT
jgi:hypothetical protein